MPSAVYYGCSMYRVFTPGEKLFLSEVEFDSLQAGDIIAIRKPGEKQYVHRVIEKNAQYAVTMGDNNPTADLLQKNTFAVMIQFIKKIRRRTEPEFSSKLLY